MAAWVAAMGDDGDFGRTFVLDAPMLARVSDRGFTTALDVGCGEGRFCRILQKAGMSTVGIDPTEALIARARELDPTGDYRIERAEIVDRDGRERFCIDRYLDERAVWVSWRGIRIQNWHRPLATYMTAFLENGLELRYFSEPVATGGAAPAEDRYNRVPYFLIMEWQKP